MYVGVCVCGGGVVGEVTQEGRGESMGKCPVDSLLTELRDTQRCLSETFRGKKKKENTLFYLPIHPCRLTSESSGFQAVSKVLRCWEGACVLETRGRALSPLGPTPTDSVHMVCLCHWPWYGACVPSSWKAMIPVCFQSFWGPHTPLLPPCHTPPRQTLE